jgi:hypothetical protein
MGYFMARRELATMPEIQTEPQYLPWNDDLMTITTNTALAEILATAQAAAAAGDTARARHYFRNLTEIDPESLEAWLGYASCTTVLADRRRLFTQALSLDPASPEALEGLAQIDALLAAGHLVRPRAPEAPAVVEPIVAAPAPTIAAAAAIAVPVRSSAPSLLLAVGLVGLTTMTLLTGVGIFVLTSFWGFMLAFIAGPLVSELMVRLSGRARHAKGGKGWQIAAAVGMLLGGLAALLLGSMLLPALGVPLPPEAVRIALSSGVGGEPAAVLLNNPGLLIFISSAVAATVYRMR